LQCPDVIDHLLVSVSVYRLWWENPAWCFRVSWFLSSSGKMNPSMSWNM